ncbi:MAG: aldo/keto reductase [Planctomycetaceae bacterium]|nr:aldo/keto reductase [Planctomycetaceae bacterium]
MSRPVELITATVRISFLNLTREASYKNNKPMQPHRCLGKTNIEITPVAMGCWPVTGITSVDVTRERSEATIRAAWHAGINFFDTAYMYGYDGESEKMIGDVLHDVRDEIVIATKCGLHWKNKASISDATPKRIIAECDESLLRLGTDRVELYYLHTPDPQVPIAESAGAIRELMQAGKVLSAGLSNASVAELTEFNAVCPLSAYQPHYNMLQREIEDSQIPWCIENSVSAMVYWPLMKGLLAGKLPRDHQFHPKDGRQKYPMFQGEEWERNHDFIDRLREIATDTGHSVPDLVINWTIQRSGITAALCGAKRPEQIVETAATLSWQLSQDAVRAIDQAIADRGSTVSRSAV